MVLSSVESWRRIAEDLKGARETLHEESVELRSLSLFFLLFLYFFKFLCLDFVFWLLNDSLSFAACSAGLVEVKKKEKEKADELTGRAGRRLRD